MMRNSVTKLNGETIERGRPISHRAGPLVRDVSRRQVEEFEERIDCWEEVSVTAYLPKGAVERLDRVGRVDDLPDLRWIVEERNQPFPVSLPASADRGKPRVVALAKVLKGHLCGFGRRGVVDVFQLLSDLFALFPANISEAVAQHVNDAQLDLRLRKNRLNRLRQADKAVDTADQDVRYPAIFQLGKDVQPEARPFVCRGPHPEKFQIGRASCRE